MESPPLPGTQTLPDYYRILQVDPAAESTVIEAVYHRLARKYDPKTNPDPSAAAHLAQIRAAYETLSDPQRRTLYDVARGLALRVAALEAAVPPLRTLAPASSGAPPAAEPGVAAVAPSVKPGPPVPGQAPVAEQPTPPAPDGEGSASGRATREEADLHPASGALLPQSEGDADDESQPAANVDRPAEEWPPPFPTRTPSEWLPDFARAHPEATAVAGLVLLSLLIRTVALTTTPPNVTADESDNLQVVYHILAGRGAPGLFGLDWKPAPAFSVYLMAGFMSVCGWSIAGMRAASAVLSSLAIVPFYCVARERLSVAGSLVSAFLLSTGLWYLHFSRSGWENAQGALFAMMAAWMLVLALRGRGLRYYALAGFWCALGLYGYFAGRLIVVSLLAYLPFALWERRGKAGEVLVGYVVLLLVCVAVFAPQAPSIVRNWEGFNNRTRTVAITSAQLPYEGARTMPELVARQIGKTARAFLLLDGTVQNNPRYFPVGRPIFDPLTGVLFLVGIVAALRAWRKTALWWCLALLPLGVTQVLSLGTPDLARAVPAAPALYLFVGYGFDRLAPRPGSARRVLQLAAVALLPVAGYENPASYATWMSQPEAATVRGPAVEVREFDLWQSLQYKAAAAGERGFTAGQWQEMRKQFGLSAAQPGGQAAAAPQLPPGPVPRVTPRPDLATFEAAYGGDLFRDPRGVAVDTTGAIYVADAGKHQVVKLDPEGRPVLTWGREGRGDGEFLSPWDVAVDSAGHVYVLDSEAQVVQRFDQEGHFQARLLASAAFYRPRGLAVDSAGAVYVADTGRNRVVKMAPGGEVATVFGASATTAALDQPTDVAVDAAGNVYVVEPAAKRLQKLGPNGNAVAAWDFSPTDTRDAPHLAVAGDRLLASDPHLQRIDVYSPDGALVGFWGSPGASDGQFNAPMGVVADAVGRVYVADVKNGRVQRFRLGE